MRGWTRLGFADSLEEEQRPPDAERIARMQLGSLSCPQARALARWGGFLPWKRGFDELCTVSARRVFNFNFVGYVQTCVLPGDSRVIEVYVTLHGPPYRQPGPPLKREHLRGLPIKNRELKSRRSGRTSGGVLGHGPSSEPT